MKKYSLTKVQSNNKTMELKRYSTTFVFKKVIKNKTAKTYVEIYGYCFNNLKNNISKEFEELFIKTIKNYDSEEIKEKWNTISNFEKNNINEEIKEIKPKKINVVL